MADSAKTINAFGTNTVQDADLTLPANYGLVIADEYVMDATHELVFSDPSEMVVI